MPPLSSAVEWTFVQETHFDYLHHFVTVPVLLNDVETRFILDSGIGLTLVRDTIDGCAPIGTSFTGKRMSGQAVTAPLAIAPTLDFAGIAQSDVEVGLFDMSGFPPELAHIDGFLSLAFFSEQPFTVDYGRRTIGDGTRPTGTRVDVQVDRDGPSLAVFMPLTIPGGRSISAEIDMGSDSLILDDRFAEETGALLRGNGVRRVEGTDETGHVYARTFTRLPGRIHPTAAPELAQDEPDVMFQRIVHDGLVGDAFLRRFVVTWDLPASSIVLAPAA